MGKNSVISCAFSIPCIQRIYFNQFFHFIAILVQTCLCVIKTFFFREIKSFGRSRSLFVPIQRLQNALSQQNFRNFVLSSSLQISELGYKNAVNGFFEYQVTKYVTHYHLQLGSHFLHFEFFYRDDITRFSSTNSFWDDPLTRIDGKRKNNMGMCIAVDPRSYNYRWNTKYCNGPDTASFVCQIPGRKLTRGFHILKV